MMSERMAPYQCPVCRSRLDAATNLTGKTAPTDGDVSICFDCSSIVVFTADLKLRLPTDDELLVYVKDERITRIVTLVAQSIAERQVVRGH